MHFKDKVIWITGASSGIGAELAKQFAAEKAWLIISARNIVALEEVKKSCLEHTQHCDIIPADMLDEQNLKAVTQQALSIHGHLDVVIFSAGVSQRSFAADTTMEVYRKIMGLNFFAPVQITKYLLPHFKERPTGHIVAISSVAGLMGFPMRTGYSASKHALHGFFETLQTESSDNIDFTIISPGRIKTPISLHAVTGDGTPHGKMDEGQLKGIPVDVCVRKIIHGIKSKKKHVIIARGERLLWWIWWFLPALYYKIARKRGLP